VGRHWELWGGLVGFRAVATQAEASIVESEDLELVRNPIGDPTHFGSLADLQAGDQFGLDAPSCSSLLRLIAVFFCVLLDAPSCSSLLRPTAVIFAYYLWRVCSFRDRFACYAGYRSYLRAKATRAVSVSCKRCVASHTRHFMPPTRIISPRIASPCLPHASFYLPFFSQVLSCRISVFVYLLSTCPLGFFLLFSQLSFLL
jgi:hypothetical protein